MRKLLSGWLAILLSLCWASSAFASALDSIMDFSDRSVEKVDLLFSDPALSCYDWISRYSYSEGNLFNTEPMTMFLDYVEMYGPDITKKLGYYFSILIDGASCYFSESMKLLYYSFDLLDSSDDSQAQKKKVVQAFMAVQCLEIGDGQVAQAYAKAYGMDCSDAVQPLFSKLYLAAQSDSGDSTCFQTENFCYFIEHLTIPAREGKAEHQVSNIIAIPIA